MKIKRKIKYLIENNLVLALLFSHYKLFTFKLNFFFNEFLKKEIVLIWQMGRVGSGTIVKTLKQYKQFAVYHVHFLSDECFENDIIFANKKWKGKKSKILIHSIHRKQCEFLRRQLFLNNKKRRKIKIISLIRDPVSRDISDFFYHIEYYIKNDNFFSSKTKLDELYNTFFSRNNSIKYMQNWIERELIDFLSLNIPNHVDLKGKGYVVVKKEFFDFFLIKLEYLEKIIFKIFEEYFNLNDVKILRDHDTSLTKKGNLYINFIKNFRCDSSYLDVMYNNKFVKLFYSDYEIMSLKKKWQKK